MNPNNDAYWRSRRHDNRQNSRSGNSEYSQAELNNHANQMNPNDNAYQSSRRI